MPTKSGKVKSLSDDTPRIKIIPTVKRVVSVVFTVLPIVCQIDFSAVCSNVSLREVFKFSLTLSNTIIDSVISVSVGNPEACLQHQGACLNGKWADVHKYHAQYRTNLRIFGEIPA